MSEDEEEGRKAFDEALVSLSIEPEALSLAEIEEALGPNTPGRHDRPRRHWIAEFGRPVGGSPVATPADATLNTSLARLEAFLEARADSLATVAAGANFLVMITWTVHFGASPVTMTPTLIRALAGLNAVVWIDGYGTENDLVALRGPR